MKPWDDFDRHVSDEELDKMWKQVTPSEFFFARSQSSDDDGEEYVWIVPASYFEKEGCCCDQHMPIDDFLPRSMSQAMESCWDFRGPWEQIRQELLNRGFRESKEFSEFIADQ